MKGEVPRSWDLEGLGNMPWDVVSDWPGEVCRVSDWQASCLQGGWCTRSEEGPRGLPGSRPHVCRVGSAPDQRRGSARVQAGAEGQRQCLRGCTGEDVEMRCCPNKCKQAALLGFTV